MRMTKVTQLGGLVHVGVLIISNRNNFWVIKATGNLLEGHGRIQN